MGDLKFTLEILELIMKSKKMRAATSKVATTSLCTPI